ncbi:hypothetical protein VM1G_08171 [Cytospora mali]|uniref:Uncharacterized protein n=1 Tax=Cytospora mali TaxID=578113 RepID=A0A194W973_CYTMA|nr:hypothetical protein VM1G_08171 [Valsa mali]
MTEAVHLSDRAATFVAREQGQAGSKKRRTDAHSRASAASVPSSNKRKRRSDTDEEARDDEVQASQPGRGVPRAKRTRFDKATMSNDTAGTRDRNRTSRAAPVKAAAVTLPARATRHKTGPLHMRSSGRGSDDFYS